ncbi:glycoside hydrolase family 13 protein [Tessaracoccus sp. MC1865]|uniref:glycoside hydrolase family 13 protein n=1 Tax=Tessaracoccus sp. MC1865 TaxID=2760310 RepID=UPI0016021E2B|nr:glycoside hydrolase family 13 protein [Tessaracoccus sp. MC1865]MBB1483897.1 glycoside hydrolase family 13 protein [Tessaracoccus sp. MC1865]QTO36949.1 glycoside hydrolase family 13 protein [Tessaracoccus sp. MC1865]
MATEWWRDAVIYQIYPRSFADSTGDGYGDLPGIIDRLPYLRQLGVDAVWLSPFYTSPMSDAGYDVADYFSVDPLFGDITDAERLIERSHELDIRVLVDLVPNHTSDEHKWFRQARSSEPGSLERGRYHFVDGLGENGELPPNNWKSVFGGPAWTRVDDAAGNGERTQWYLHLFDVKQPDLNWSNEEVRKGFDEILRFWLDKGADGFRVDVAHALVKAHGLPDWDEDQAMLDGLSGPMWDQDGVHDIYRRWRRILDEYDGDRSLVAEAWVSDPDRLALYLRPDEMHTAFNFQFLDSRWDAEEYRTKIPRTRAADAEVGAPTTWVLNNHDVVRSVSRFGLADPGSSHEGLGSEDEQPDNEVGLRRARAAALLMLGLPGSAYLYQGEELGLPEHTTLPDELRQDPTWFRSEFTRVGRDGCRIPMAWEADRAALGFSPNGARWLPQPPEYRSLAVDQQVGVEGSTWELYHSALALRKELGLGSGSLDWVHAGEHIVAFDNGRVRVMTNVLGEAVPLPEGYRVLLSSTPLDDGVLPTDASAWFTAE